jgi:hypothetical protein
MLITDDSRQMHFHMVSYFTHQDDYCRNDQIIRIDDVLLRGVVEPLLELFIVATLLKFLILVRDLSKILSEHHLLLICFEYLKEC